ncbi:unnamed protein product, partial [marine sediment metagenome]
MKKWIIALIILGVGKGLCAQPGPIQPIITNLTQFVNQTAWRIFYSNADGDIVELALGANATVLTSSGASSAPAWGAAGAGDITSIWDDLTGAVTQPVIGSGEFLDGGTATSDAAGEGILLPRAADVSAATAEGQISWDTDNDLLYVGDGAAAKSIAGSFDSTAVDATTWSDGSNATNAWTFDVSGTDHTMTAGNGVMTFGDSVTITDALTISEGKLADSTIVSADIKDGEIALADIYALGDGEIIIGDGAAAPVALDVGSSTAITILGTVATGVWQGTAVDHERGGLEADVSGYSGLIAIASGSTAEIDDLDELEGQLADVTRIVTEAVMPVASADPDVDAAGELSIDTDGANEPNDVVLRSIDGGNTPLQIALCQQQKSFQATIITPNDLANATRDACPIWSNETG